MRALADEHATHGCYRYHERDGIALYHGDCRALLPTLDPASIALVLTDPPYGIALDTNNQARQRGRAAAANDYAPIAGDDAPFDPAHLLRFPRLILFGANHYAQRLPPSPSWLVWDKLAGLTSDRALGFNNNADAELLYTNLGGPVRILAHRWMGMVKGSERATRRVHPTQKPVALMRRLLTLYSKPGDLILDPYMGSGPVARACLDLQRRYLGIELVEAYCALARDRLTQLALTLDDED